MHSPLAPRPPFDTGLRVAAAVATLLLASCTLEAESGSDQATTAPPSGDSARGNWYVSDTEIFFDMDLGSYEVAHFIGGSYQMTEMGDFVFNGVPGTLSGFPLVDLMGDLGLSDNGAPFQIDVLAMTDETMVIVDRNGVTVTLSPYPPSLDTPPINDTFEGSELDPRWWSMGNSWVSDGKLHLQDNASAAGLWQLGFTRVQADITLEAVTGHSNVALGFRPYDQNIMAKCGVGQSDLWETTVFCQVLDLETEESLFYADLLPTALGNTHQVMMVWSGGMVEFYADGTLIESYLPEALGNLSFCGEPDVFGWGDGVYGTVDNFKAQY